MNCTNCGKETLPDSALSEDGYIFCSSICRFEWRAKGKPTPFASRTPSEPRPTVDDLEFPVNPPGFENRGMRVRLSYLKAPKVFLDGSLLKPVRSGFLWRIRKYTARSNFGKEVAIQLRGRAFDQVPEMKIDGQQFLIARPLTRWEHIWIALPAFLLYGGALGGLIGAAAIFSNSILMRRVGHVLPRFALTGGTTAMAFLLFFKTSAIVTPMIQTFAMRLTGQTVEDVLKAGAEQVNRKCPWMIDDETRLDSATVGTGRTFTYHYTFVRQSIEKLDIPHVKDAIRPGIALNVRTNSEMAALRNFQVTFNYAYVDRNGRPAFDLSITPPDYN